MKQNYIYLFLFLFIFISTSCDEIEPEVTDKATTGTPRIKSDFDTDLFRSVISAEPADKNVIISPISVITIMQMILVGAGGNSAAEITSAYGDGFTADEILADGKNFYNWIDTRSGSATIELSNAMFYDQNRFDPLQLYTDQLSENFNTERLKGNFAYEEASLKMINEWVNTKTNTRIPTILNSINPDEVMFLVNALYLKADWLEGFDERRTYDRDFTLSDGSVIQTSMMFTDRVFNNYQDENLHVVELPYKDEEVSMYLIKPLKGNVNELISTFSAGEFSSIKEQLKNERLLLTMPRFEVEYKNEQMVDRLKTLGINEIFTSKANLTKMAEQKNLRVTRVIHKTYITVNEKGTEGAAVTVGEIGLTSMPPQVDFDSPFMFIIADKVTNNFLFMGRISNP